MKKQVIPAVCMAVVSALCVGAVVVADPIPTYRFEDGGTPVVMTVNGEQVHANEYASYFLSAKNGYENQMAQFGADTESLWKEQSMVDSLRASAQDMVTQYRVVLQQFKKDGLQLNRADVNEMRSYKRSIIDQLGGEEAFQSALAQQDMTEQMYDNSLVISAYAKALNNDYFGPNGKLTPSDEEMTKYFSDNYIQAKHILIQTTGEDGKALSDAEKAQKKALAEEIAKKAAAGEDFDALIKQYNEDPGMDSSPDGYIFTQGEMVDEFYNGAKALKENEVSGVVESQFGYHIIKRLPLDTSKMDTYRDAILKGASGKDFSTLLQEWSTAAKVETVDAEMNKITVDNAAETAKLGDTGRIIAPSKAKAAATAASTSATQSAD
ncbi:MAG: hypothetical protein EOM63_02985 [Clostridia bacterium]|nr:hypothetical protein [Clostridia bacterium]